MTKEEAIKTLQEDYCGERFFCELHQDGLCSTEDCEIWLAIKALETQPDGDTISRKAAINIVVFECGEWAGLAEEISKQLRQLPSAQPETHEKRTETHERDSISRKDAIRIVDSIDTWQAGWRGNAIESLKAMSPAERTERCIDCKNFNKTQLLIPQPERKTGRWILVKGSNGKDYHKCSNCLHTQDITGVKNYCAVCGADMMEVEHE